MIASGIQPGADKQKAQRAQRAPEHRAKQPRQLLPEGTLSRKKSRMISRQTGVARIAPTSGWMTRRPGESSWRPRRAAKSRAVQLRITGSPKDAFHMQ
jgi:hypothetical protein